MADVLLSLPAWQVKALSALVPSVGTAAVLWLVLDAGRFVRLAITGRL